MSYWDILLFWWWHAYIQKCVLAIPQSIDGICLTKFMDIFYCSAVKLNYILLSNAILIFAGEMIHCSLFFSATCHPLWNCSVFIKNRTILLPVFMQFSTITLTIQGKIAFFQHNGNKLYYSLMPTQKISAWMKKF